MTEMIDIPAAKEYVLTNYPNDPLLRTIALTLLDKLPKTNVGFGQSLWIPVTERLPEENDRYLCNVKSFAFPGCSYHAILHYDKHDGFREGNIYTDDVTHWMPLPEPPKEVDHD